MGRISNFKDFIKRFIKHPLFSGGLIMVGGNMIVNGVNYLYHLLMGRILGPVDYGVLASLYSIIYLVGIVPTSASVTVVKFISSAKDKNEAYSIYSSIRKFIFFFSVIVSLILLVLSPIISRFLNITNYWLVGLISIVLFFILNSLVNQATSQGLLKFMGSVGPNFLSAVTKLTAGLILIYLGLSVFGVVVGIVIAVLVSYSYSLWFLRRILKKRKSRPYNLKPFFKYSFPVLVQALAFTSLFSVDVVLVKHFLTPFEAGIYSALSTLGKIIYFATSPIASTMFPIVSGRKSRGEAYEKIFIMSFIVTVVASLAIVAFYWLFPNIAIGVLYGKAYLSAKPELVWMGFFMLFYSLANLLVNYSLSLGKTKIVVFPFVACILQVVLIWFFHKSILSVIQVSMAVTISMFLGLSLYLGYNRLVKRYD